MSYAKEDTPLFRLHEWAGSHQHHNEDDNNN